MGQDHYVNASVNSFIWFDNNFHNFGSPLLNKLDEYTNKDIILETTAQILISSTNNTKVIESLIKILRSVKTTRIQVCEIPFSTQLSMLHSLIKHKINDSK